MSDLSFAKLLAFASDLIRIPSPSGGEGDVAERVLQELESLGFDEVWRDEVGNVFGLIRGRGTGPTVMLSSHLDAVDVGDADSWEYPPYGGVIADGYLHGRGAMDIKGPLAVQTYAAARFLGERPAGDIVIAHTVFEERAGWGMSHLMESDVVRPDIVILGEATGGDICIGHRGRAELIVEAQGVAGHASAPERARNPLDLLESILPALREFASRLPTDPVLGPATLAPTAIETLPRSKNVIPDRARVTLDWRILPGLTPAAALTAVRDFLASRVPLTEGYHFEVRLAFERQRTYTGREEERDLFTHGFLLDPEHPVAIAAARAVAESTGREPRLRPWTFATDGGQTCGNFGVPTIGYAPGEERHAHTNRERLELNAARTVYEAYPALIRAVQAALLGPSTATSATPAAPAMGPG